MGSIPAGNIRESYKPCKKRDDTTRVSLLTNEAVYLFFYRAPCAIITAFLFSGMIIVYRFPSLTDRKIETLMNAATNICVGNIDFETNK